MRSKFFIVSQPPVAGNAIDAKRNNRYSVASLLTNRVAPAKLVP